MAKCYLKHKQMGQHENAMNKVKGNEDLTWYLMFGITVFLTLCTRFYKVTEPDHVCWDETHFGKMGSWYINRTFFFDVHPPLGKMLIALSGYMTGYDGTFQFEKPGDKYDNVNYIGMRVFCTLLGSSVVPLSYLIVWDLTNSISSAFLSAILLIFDVGLLTLNQYILLDPILLCFMMCATWGMTHTGSLRKKPFTRTWWCWLAFTGISLACTFSVKFVGLFVVLLTGLYTACELWRELGNLNNPITYVGKHLLARCLCLIVLPVLMYALFFYIHLSVLNKSGSGDGFYSSEFQSLLQGNSLHNASMPRELAYGATITLKNHRTGGGYLHSHWHLYPEGIGARQQQITTYSHKDDNNLWLIKKYDTNVVPSKPELVTHGDLVRLEHVVTKRNLHAHKEVAPISKKHYQVTGYGESTSLSTAFARLFDEHSVTFLQMGSDLENGTGDANDVWKVLILHGKKGDVVQTVTSKLKFVHYLHHCVLSCSGKTLPKWGYNQQEISCNPNIRDKNALWNVEDNRYAKLPNVSFHVYAPSFFKRFLESHAVMFQGNSDLRVKEGEVSSKPWQWPINYKGQFFSGNNQRIYLLGNPIIWWSNIVFLVIFVTLCVHVAVLDQRGCADNSAITKKRRDVVKAGSWLFVGWLLHYVPFWTMSRILYFHHYFPALLYNSMLTGVTLNFILDSSLTAIPKRLANTFYYVAVGTLVSVVIYSFCLFSPLAYGMDGPPALDPKSSMHNLRWMDTWEF